MCLISDKKTIQIAKEDISVYKVLRGNLKSYYFGYKYTLNELHTTKLKKRKLRDIWNAYDSVDEAYLYENYSGWNPRYSDNVEKIDYSVRKKLICVEEGFHSVLVSHRLSGPSVAKGIIWECIIPKGSKYYTDNTNCIVSNQIIIKKEYNARD